MEHLETDETVADLVEDRIFPVRKPDGTKHPLIVYRRISTLTTSTHDGPGLRGPRFEFSCWGATETEARQVRRAVAAAFDSVRTPDFHSFVDNEGEAYDPTPALPRAIVDVRIWFDPAIEAAS